MPDRQHDGEEELLAQVQLSMVAGIGPRRFTEVLQHFGSARQAIEMMDGCQAVQLPLSGWQLPPLSERFSRDQAVEILQQCQRAGVHVITRQSDDYPALLEEIHDPPPLLYLRGRPAPEDALTLAIVGTRFATPYGLETAARLARAAAQAGFSVVSGLARGIDGAAHEATLQVGGRAIAVLAGGLAQIYPSEHAGLANEVSQQGLLVTELPPQTRPTAGAFPRRNRLISGLSLGILVVEAPDRSGALITAQLGLEQGREVFAVPGQINRPASRGCHQLIRDGATLVESLDDVIEQLGPLMRPTTGNNGQAVRHPRELTLNETERTVLDAIPTCPTLVDQVIRASQLSAAQVLATLSVLETRRLVVRHAGQQVQRL